MLRSTARFLFYTLQLVPWFDGNTGKTSVWLVPELLQKGRRRRSEAPSGVVFWILGEACLSPTLAATVRVTTQATFLFCAVGLGGSGSRLVAALGYLYLSGICNEFGSAKKTIVPMFTLLPHAKLV